MLNLIHVHVYTVHSTHTPPLTDLQFLQLSLDGVHVFDKGVEVGHVEVHRLQPLEETLVVSKELQPTSVEGSDSGLVLCVAGEREREVKNRKVCRILTFCLDDLYHMTWTADPLAFPLNIVKTWKGLCIQERAS